MVRARGPRIWLHVFERLQQPLRGFEENQRSLFILQIGEQRSSRVPARRQKAQKSESVAGSAGGAQRGDEGTRPGYGDYWNAALVRLADDAVARI